MIVLLGVQICKLMSKINHGAFSTGLHGDKPGEKDSWKVGRPVSLSSLFLVVIKMTILWVK